MRREQLIMAILTVTLLSGCSMPLTYSFVKIDKGYTIKKTDRIFNEFTMDDKGKTPESLALAKERFKRREKYVLDWYRKYRPNDLKNPELELLRSIFYVPAYVITLPLRIVKSFFPQPEVESGLKQIQEEEKRELAAAKEMQNFIAEDCNKESLEKHN